MLSVFVRIGEFRDGRISYEHSSVCLSEVYVHHSRYRGGRAFFVYVKRRQIGIAQEQVELVDGVAALRRQRETASEYEVEVRVVTPHVSRKGVILKVAVTVYPAESVVVKCELRDIEPVHHYVRIAFFERALALQFETRAPQTFAQPCLRQIYLFQCQFALVLRSRLLLDEVFKCRCEPYRAYLAVERQFGLYVVKRAFHHSVNVCGDSGSVLAEVQSHLRHQSRDELAYALRGEFQLARIQMDVGAVGSEDVVYVKRQVGLYAAMSVGEFGLSYMEVRYGAFGLQSVYVQQNGTVLEDAAEVTYAIQRQGSRRGVYRKLYLVQKIREVVHSTAGHGVFLYGHVRPLVYDSGVGYRGYSHVDVAVA